MDFNENQAEYAGIHYTREYTGINRNIQELIGICTGICTGIDRNTKEYKGIHRNTQEYKGIHRNTQE
jgi:hypothetical protein